jgi:hypothetical protein
MRRSDRASAVPRHGAVGLGPSRGRESGRPLMFSLIFPGAGAGVRLERKEVFLQDLNISKIKEDVGGFRADGGDPLLHSLADELRAIV